MQNHTDWLGRIKEDIGWVGKISTCYGICKAKSLLGEMERMFHSFESRDVYDSVILTWTIESFSEASAELVKIESKLDSNFTHEGREQARLELVSFRSRLMDVVDYMEAFLLFVDQ